MQGYITCMCNWNIAHVEHLTQKNGQCWSILTENETYLNGQFQRDNATQFILAHLLRIEIKLRCKVATW